MTIPVDINQNNPLALSEIAEELIAINLELTDESLINPDAISDITISENYIIVTKWARVLVFDKDGKFVRAIGRVGQGPGSFIFIRNVVIDEKNERLFLLSGNPSKIISFDLNGTFLNEVSVRNLRPKHMSYVNGKLLLVSKDIRMRGRREFSSHSVLYRLDDSFQVIDSLCIRRTSVITDGLTLHTSFAFINKSIVQGAGGTTYFYLNELGDPPTEIVLRDTLYRLEGNQLIPELRLSFRNDGISRAGNRFIDLKSIFRSSRYVFSIYKNTLTGNTYQFVFDTKTGKSSNMQGGFIDDINNIEERIIISPLTTNSEIFYFWHTHMDPDDFEEPNPTLYVGRLRRLAGGN